MVARVAWDDEGQSDSDAFSQLKNEKVLGSYSKLYSKLFWEICIIGSSPINSDLNYRLVGKALFNLRA